MLADKQATIIYDEKWLHGLAHDNPHSAVPFTDVEHDICIFHSLSSSRIHRAYTCPDRIVSMALGDTFVSVTTLNTGFIKSCSISSHCQGILFFSS